MGHRARGALRLVGALVAGWILALPAVPAASEPLPRVRVLLYEGPGPVRIRISAERTHTVRRHGEGLSLDGAARRSPLPLRPVLEGPLQVEGKAYRGELEIWRQDDTILVVNVVGIEPYLAGTLMREVYPSWGSEVLEAQAIVARTYALHQLEKGSPHPYDLRSGTRSQVYGGVEAETEAAWRAVRDTRGMMVAYEGRPILAVYHAASGGRTASAEEVWGEAVPYLVSVAVKGERSHREWREVVNGEALGRALRSLGVNVGRIEGLEVSRRSRSGRAYRLQVKGPKGSREIRARDLRTVLGVNRIRSTNFRVERTPKGFQFVGSGWGHGVGMSQWGAQAMAKRGATAPQILRKFYPGASLMQWGAEDALPAEAAQ